MEQTISSRPKIEARLSWVPDLQCAWQILLQCASPRCHHLLRIVPPSQAEQYADGHDQGMMTTMEALLEGLPGDVEQKAWARRIATIHAYGRVGFAFCNPHVPRSILGLVGRCTPYDFSTTSRGGERHCHTIGRGASRMFGRAPGGSSGFGSVRFRGPTQLGCSEGSCQTTCARGDGTWRVAPTAGNIMRLLLPSSTTGRPWCCHSRRLPTRPIFGLTRVQAQVLCSTDPQLSLSTKCNLCSSGENEVAPPDHRSSVRVQFSVGQAGPTSGCLPEIRQVAFEGIAHRTNSGTSLPRSRGLCQVQLSLARHEREC